MSRLSHEQIKQQYIGKAVDWDKVAGVQCADFAKMYVELVHGKRWRAFGGWPTKEGGVINAFYNYPNCFIYQEDYELITNNPADANQIPQQGDIVIWGDYELTNQWGHIGVVDTANKLGFVSIDQNWMPSNGIDIQLENHDYRGVLGWLRLRKKNPTPPTVINPTPGGSTKVKGDKKMYQVKRGIWRWNVVDELIQAGIYTGSHNENLPRFNALNPVTPQGGYQPGTWAVYDVVKVPKPEPTPVPQSTTSSTPEEKTPEDKKVEPQDVERSEDVVISVDPAELAGDRAALVTFDRETGDIEKIEEIPKPLKASNPSSNLPQKTESVEASSIDELANIVANQIAGSIDKEALKENVENKKDYYADKLEDNAPGLIQAIGNVVGERVQKLLSTRLWFAVGGTYLTDIVGNDIIITAIVGVVMGGLYIASETIIKSSKK